LKKTIRALSEGVNNLAEKSHQRILRRHWFDIEALKILSSHETAFLQN